MPLRLVRVFAALVQVAITPCDCSLVAGISLAFTALVKDMSWCWRFVSVKEFGVDE